jgi:hypothetical protein
LDKVYFYPTFFDEEKSLKHLTLGVAQQDKGTTESPGEHETGKDEGIYEQSGLLY